VLVVPEPVESGAGTGVTEPDGGAMAVVDPEPAAGVADAVEAEAGDGVLEPAAGLELVPAVLSGAAGRGRRRFFFTEAAAWATSALDFAVEEHFGAG
jgi:hypothetical protein